MNTGKILKLILIIFFGLLTLSVFYLGYRYFSYKTIKIPKNGETVQINGVIKKGKDIDEIKSYCPDELYIVNKNNTYQLKTSTKDVEKASILYANKRNSEAEVTGAIENKAVGCGSQKTCECDNAILVNDLKVTKKANDNWPTFTGIIFCLEPTITKETTIPCATGLITDDGRGYFLKNISKMKLKMSEKITLTGEMETLKTKTNYKAEGTIDVFEVK